MRARVAEVRVQLRRRRPPVKRRHAAIGNAVVVDVLVAERELGLLIGNERERRVDPIALQAHEVADRNRITIHIDDPIASDLDVLGNNEYIGWYVRKPADADSIDWASEYDKPLIMSEFGGDALFGYHGDALVRWTEEYQENLYEHQIAMLKRIPFLRGMTPWVLKDFRSPRRTLPRLEDYFNRKGLVSDHGEKKKAFFVLQKYYGELQIAQPPK